MRGEGLGVRVCKVQDFDGSEGCTHGLAAWVSAACERGLRLGVGAKRLRVSGKLARPTLILDRRSEAIEPNPGSDLLGSGFGVRVWGEHMRVEIGRCEGCTRGR